MLNRIWRYGEKLRKSGNIKEEHISLPFLSCSSLASDNVTGDSVQTCSYLPERLSLRCFCRGVLLWRKKYVPRHKETASSDR